jgi:hypothetical protein
LARRHAVEQDANAAWDVVRTGGNVKRNCRRLSTRAFRPFPAR